MTQPRFGPAGGQRATVPVLTVADPKCAIWMAYEGDRVEVRLEVPTYAARQPVMQHIEEGQQASRPAHQGDSRRLARRGYVGRSASWTGSVPAPLRASIDARQLEEGGCLVATRRGERAVLLASSVRGSVAWMACGGAATR